MSDSNSNPLSFKNLMAGIIVTVIGGIILALIFQGAGDSSSQENSASQPSNGNDQSSGPAIEVFVTPTLAPPTQENACLNAPEKRLKVGDAAIVCTASEAVHLRSGPRRDATSMDKLPPGKRMMVIGGPTCDESAQWWYWEIRIDSGASGWIAEGGDQTDPYFICPIN